MKKKTIVILYSQAKREFFISKDLFLTEEEVYPRCKIIKPRFEKLGYKVILLPGDINTIKKIKILNPNIVFNLVDSVQGREDLSPLIPAILEIYKIPYTGSNMISLTINTNKYLTKCILKQAGIPVPNFQLFNNHTESINRSLKFPLIVKLNRFHGSIDISEHSVVENEKELRARIKLLIIKYNQEVLVEEYIKGKEITILIVDGKKKLILAEERLFLIKNKYNLFGFKEAWSDEEFYDVKKYSLSRNIKNDIKEAFKLLQMSDYARFEIIIDGKGKHYLIDPNANPAFGPKEAGEAFGYLLFLYKIPFSSVVKKIISNARSRFDS